MEIDRVREILAEWGKRLRAARIERNDTMEIDSEPSRNVVGSEPRGGRGEWPPTRSIEGVDRAHTQRTGSPERS